MGSRPSTSSSRPGSSSGGRTKPTSMSPAWSCSHVEHGVADVEVELDVGVARAVGVDDRAGDAAGERTGQADAQPPALARAGGARHRGRVLGLRQHRARLVQQRRARRRERHAAAVAVKERDPELGLQRAHLLADAGLGHVQALGRAAEVQLLGHHHERPQLTQLHPRMIGAAFHSREHWGLIGHALGP